MKALKIIKKIIFGVLTAASAVIVIKEVRAIKTRKQNAPLFNRYKMYYETYVRWFYLKQNNIKIEDYLIANGYKNIAIYGMGNLGQALYEELKNSKVNIEFAIDRNEKSQFDDLTIVDINNVVCNNVDAIIITAVADKEIIIKDLNATNKINCDILCLDDIVYNMQA